MNAEPAILLVDISNTRTKFMRLSAEGILPECRMLATAEISPESLAVVLHSWSYAAACVSSVVPGKAQVLAAYLAVPLHFVSANDSAGVDFSFYPGAETLGADRVANAIAAAHYGRFPVVAVDMGTATTFDVVSLRNGIPVFMGGSIAPGVGCLRRFFHTSTAQLPPVKETETPCAIGKNTAQAMQSGLMLGYCGLLREILSGIEKESGEKIYILATGGDSPLMSHLMPNMFQICPLLTFEGIAAVARSVFPHVLAENPPQS